MKNFGKSSSKRRPFRLVGVKGVVKGGGGLYSYIEEICPKKRPNKMALAASSSAFSFSLALLEREEMKLLDLGIFFCILLVNMLWLPEGRCFSKALFLVSHQHAP